MSRIDESLDPEPGEIWHPYWHLEEVSHNMWGDIRHRKTWLEIAVAFTGNADLYGDWMRKVTEQWRMSCEHALTKRGDKRPWMGHAAVAMAMRCPEDIVREAWGLLSAQQQDRANAKAAEAIEYWRSLRA